MKPTFLTLTQDGSIVLIRTEQIETICEDSDGGSEITMVGDPENCIKVDDSIHVITAKLNCTSLAIA